MYDKNKPIVMGADHLGLPLKNAVRDYLRGLGYTRRSTWASRTRRPWTIPTWALRWPRRFAPATIERGILVCGTGAGMAIVANKVQGVRAVCVADPYTAERAVASNNAQVITFGSQITGPAVAQKLIDVWLASEYQGGRSAPKVDKINKLDERASG